MTVTRVQKDRENYCTMESDHILYGDAFLFLGRVELGQRYNHLYNPYKDFRF